MKDKREDGWEKSLGSRPRHQDRGAGELGSGGKKSHPGL